MVMPRPASRSSRACSSTASPHPARPSAHRAAAPQAAWPARRQCRRVFLAETQVVHWFVGQLAHADGGQRRIHRQRTVAVQPEIERAEGDVLDHAGRKQLAVRVLEHQPDPAAQRIQAGAAVIDRLAGKTHAASGRPQQGVEVLEQEVLPAPLAPSALRLPLRMASEQCVEADHCHRDNVAEGAASSNRLMRQPRQDDEQGEAAAGAGRIARAGLANSG